jgi:hypothetical protein
MGSLYDVNNYDYTILTILCKILKTKSTDISCIPSISFWDKLMKIKFYDTDSKISYAMDMNVSILTTKCLHCLWKNISFMLSLVILEGEGLNSWTCPVNIAPNDSMKRNIAAEWLALLCRVTTRPAFRGTVSKTYVKSRVPHFAWNVPQISFFIIYSTILNFRIQILFRVHVKCYRMFRFYGLIKKIQYK